MTYGNITNADRKMMKLEKTHANDAVSIAKHKEIISVGDLTLQDDTGTTLFVQHRKKKRSLHEANPRKGTKAPNREAKHNKKNTKRVGNACLLDSVIALGQKGIITGFDGTSCYAVNKADQYVTKYKNGKMIPISNTAYLYRNNNWETRWKENE